MLTSSVLLACRLAQPSSTRTPGPCGKRAQGCKEHLLRTFPLYLSINLVPYVVSKHLAVLCSALSLAAGLIEILGPASPLLLLQLVQTTSSWLQQHVVCTPMSLGSH